LKLFLFTLFIYVDLLVSLFETDKAWYSTRALVTI